MQKPVVNHKPTTLYNKATNWETFENEIEKFVNCNIPLKTSKQGKTAIDDLKI